MLVKQPLKTIHFAPMEGITDPLYREAIMKLYPEWDFFSTDFLRLPTVGKLKTSKIISHIGENIYNTPTLMDKTYFQILTTTRVNNKPLIKSINSLKIKRLDLNLGCPSRKVNSHGGGSFLLKNLEDLKIILSDIRQNFDHHFSVKMRIGYENTDNFTNLLQLFEQIGIDQIIIHARTKKELYRGKADWNYFNLANDISKLPLVFNGDITAIEDIDYLHQKYPTSALMCARGALRYPWLAKVYKKKTEIINSIEIKNYYLKLLSIYTANSQPDLFILKRFKSLSVYIINDLELKSLLLRSQSILQFLKILHNS